MSDLTEESFPEGLEMQGAKDLENYDKLME
jgi:sperm-associated antigen 16 protein